MRRPNGFRNTLLLVALALCATAIPAAADLTVISRYTLVNGDTLTRASYYSTNRVRVTAPDGREYLFDAKGDTVTVINHDSRSYWKGPRTLADSLAKKLMAANRKGAELAEADPVAFAEKLQAFNDSIEAKQTNNRKKIAGYPTRQWILNAGSHLTHERWIANGLKMQNYGPELEKTVMGSNPDPLGRQLMRLLVSMRTADGLVLAGSTKFRTLEREGSFSFEAVKVIGERIPASAWLPPEGYEAIQL